MTNNSWRASSPRLWQYDCSKNREFDFHIDLFKLTNPTTVKLYVTSKIENNLFNFIQTAHNSSIHLTFVYFNVHLFISGFFIWINRSTIFRFSSKFISMQRSFKWNKFFCGRLTIDRNFSGSNLAVDIICCILNELFLHILPQCTQL